MNRTTFLSKNKNMSESSYFPLKISRVYISLQFSNFCLKQYLASPKSSDVMRIIFMVVSTQDGRFQAIKWCHYEPLRYLFSHVPSPHSHSSSISIFSISIFTKIFNRVLNKQEWMKNQQCLIVRVQKNQSYICVHLSTL